MEVRSEHKHVSLRTVTLLSFGSIMVSKEIMPRYMYRLSEMEIKDAY